MNKLIFAFFLLMGLILPRLALAQDTLSLDEVLQIALEKNYNIKMASNNRKIANNNLEQSKWSFAPTLGINGNGQYQNTNTNLKINQNPPVEISQNGAVTYNYGASVAVNYALFEGGLRHRTLDLRQSQQVLSDIAYYQSIENTLIAVMNAYYQVVFAQLNLDVANEALALSEDRLNRQYTRNELGGGNSLEVLSAQVDFNADSVTYLQQWQQFKQAFWQLEYVINEQLSGDTLPSVDRTIELGDALDINEMQSTMFDNNIDLFFAKASTAASGWELQIARANAMPRVSLNASYGYNGQENEVGIIQYNRNLGLTLGATMSWNIFNGYQQKTNEANAKINVNNALLNEEEVIQRLTRDLMTANDHYTANRRIMDKESENRYTAEINFLHAQDRYALGQATTTQLREAQLNLVRASFSYSAAAYQAKLAEIQLLKLTGTLLEGQELSEE